MWYATVHGKWYVTLHAMGYATGYAMWYATLMAGMQSNPTGNYLIIVHEI